VIADVRQKMNTIEYKFDRNLDVWEVIDLYNRSTLGERRPVNSPEIFKDMIQNADIIVSAWDGKRLVGISRTLTDYSYVAYLADLAVDQDYQRQGIGIGLIQKTKEKLKASCFITLLAAPKADSYYEKIGFERNPRAWMLRQKPEDINKGEPVAGGDATR
jgi:GNAT superfamily N-acetyltransferase